MSTVLSAQLNRPVQIHALTSLRFFAALYVVFFHVFPHSQGATPLILKFIDLGFVSVSFFFLLSGYILAIVYLPRCSQLDLRRFYIARFSRVYPLFFLTLLADTPILLHKRVGLYGLKAATLKTAATLVGHMLLLQAWTRKLQFALNEPSWSLSVEALFYLSFPVVGRALWRLNGRRIWIASAALYVGGQFIIKLSSSSLNVDQVKFNPLLHLSTFALGVLLARAQRGRNPSGSPVMPRSWILYGTFLLSTIAFLFVVEFRPLLPYTNVHDGLLAPIFAALIWALSYSDFLISRWLSQRWLVVLGESSFALYLVHIVILHWCRGDDEQMPGVAFIPYLLLCVGVSVLLFYTFEAPARKWLIRALQSPTPETIEASSDA
jgi:peptidoglycan/LPS O-acetylase OafA/YrhL